MSRDRDTELRAVQRAKRRLAAKIRDETWCAGIGIAPEPGGGFALRVNVDPEHADEVKLPSTYYGFNVEVVQIKSYRPR